jgi:hypothetical protein
MTLAKSLEERALAAWESANTNPDEGSPIWGLELEIALTLEHLQLGRTRHEKVLAELLDRELHLDSELLRLNPYQTAPGYGVSHIRMDVKKRLDALERERRQINAQHWDKTMELQARLLTLLSRHLSVGSSNAP